MTVKIPATLIPGNHPADEDNRTSEGSEHVDPDESSGERSESEDDS